MTNKIVQVDEYTRSDGTKVKSHTRGGGRVMTTVPEYDDEGHVMTTVPTEQGGPVMYKNSGDIGELPSIFISDVFGSPEDFATENPALTTIFGGISVDDIPTIEGGDIGDIGGGGGGDWVDTAIMVVQTGVKLAATAADAYMKVQAAMQSANPQIQASSMQNMNLAVQGMKENQNLLKKSMDSTLKQLGNPKDNAEFATLSETYARQKDLYQKSSTAVNRLAHAVESNNVNAISSELESYSKLQNNAIADVDTSQWQMPKTKFKSDMSSYQGSNVHKPNINQQSIGYQNFSNSIMQAAGMPQMKVAQPQQSTRFDYLDPKIQNLKQPSISNSSVYANKTQGQMSTERQKFVEGDLYKQLLDLGGSVVAGKIPTLPEGVKVIGHTADPKYLDRATINKFKSSNMKAVVYDVNGETVICYLGTEVLSGKDWGANLKMGVMDSVTRQMEHANDLAVHVKNTTDKPIKIAGHSEGGSEGMYVGIIHDIETYTYNAFPVGQNVIDKAAEIGQNNDYEGLFTHFRDPHDPVSKLRFKFIGKTYIVENPDNIPKIKTFYGAIHNHAISRMGDVTQSIPIEMYLKDNDWFVDNIGKVKFTGKDIENMGKDGLYEFYLPLIEELQRSRNILTDRDAHFMAQDGKLEYIDESEDGTQMRGYYRQLTD